MQTELYSLSKIFTENLFRIPDYQRGYSWGLRQLKDFWSDLALLDPNRDHYTGVLTLEDVPSSVVNAWSDDLWIVQSKRYRPYYVVDGQQRLTTSLVLLQCILERAAGSELNYSSTEEVRKKYIFESRDKGVSRSYIFGYERDNPSYEFLKTKIFGEQSDAHSVGEETIYTHNLQRAKEFFSERLATLASDQVQDIFTKLTQHFLFNIYVISGEIDVFVAFETMNNRGKPLSHLELLKNRLIFLSTRFDVDEHERGRLRRTINESWKTAYHFLGRNQGRPLPDDHFLATQYILYLGIRDQLQGETEEQKRHRRQLWRLYHADHDYKSYLLDRYFTPRNLAGVREAEAQLEGAQPETDRVTLHPQMLYEYSQDLKRCVETYYRLLNPEDSSFSSACKVHLSRIRRLGWGDALPVAVACVHNGANPHELEVLLVNIEKALFIRMIQMVYRDDDVDMLELAVAVARRELPIPSLIEKIQTMANKRAEQLDLSSTTIRWSRERSYYGWPGLKYFLFEYEQELKVRSRSNRDKLTWEEFAREDFEADYSTIEHIYPQKPRDQYWSDRFGTQTSRERNALRNSLGNLLALSRPKNASMGNLPFPQKRDGRGENEGYRVGSYSEIEVAASADWTPTTILDRGLRLLEFMETRWGVKLGTRAQKIASLRLSFMVGEHDDSTDDDPEDTGAG